MMSQYFKGKNSRSFFHNLQIFCLILIFCSLSLIPHGFANRQKGVSLLWGDSWATPERWGRVEADRVPWRPLEMEYPYGYLYGISEREAFSRIYRFYNVIVGILGMREGTLNWRQLVLGSHFLAILVVWLHQASLSSSVKIRKFNYEVNSPFLLQFTVGRNFLSSSCLQRQQKISYIKSKKWNHRTCTVA